MQKLYIYLTIAQYLAAVNREEQITDALGRISSIKYPDNETINYTYDAAGNLSAVQGYVTYTNYNAIGQAANINYANGVSTINQYLPTNNRLYSITTNSPTQGLQNISYTYDNGGNITEITDLMDANRTQTFTYDHLNRLTQVQSPVYGTLTYQYNEIGNMMYNSQVGTYTYGAKPHAVIQAGTNTYQYDANGNMTQRPNQTITYDYDNRPVSINRTTFIYDYSGQRVKKNSTIYIGKHYECTNGNCTKYIFAGSSRIASKTSSNTYYYHTDHLGSSSIITDNSGNKVEEIYYYPFGGTRLNQGSVNLKHKYTGQEEDPETGLYYYNARYYDPQLGRFISADSIVQEPDDPQSFNRYSYTRNNPLIYTDPTGNWYMDLYSYSGGGGGCYWCNYDPWAGSYRRQQEAYWNSVASSSSPSSSSSTSTSSSSSTPTPTPAPAPTPASSTQVYSSNYSSNYSPAVNLPRTSEYFGESNNSIGSIYDPIRNFLDESAIRAAQQGDYFVPAVNATVRAAIDVFLPQSYYEIPLVFRGGMGKVGKSGLRSFAPGKWLTHFEKHGAEFGYKNSVEYLKGAQSLVVRQSDNILRKVDSTTGITRIYDKATNEFISINPNRTIRTYFKPERGIDYWYRQPGN
jgi:RHS repeat-associated protein